MENCIFCKIINNEIPAYKLYEDSDFIVFLTIQPFFKGHCLIVPKAHYENIYDLPETISSKVLEVGKKISEAFRETYNVEGINFFQNNGKVAGQEVMHYHMHLLPRHNSDPAGGLSEVADLIHKNEEPNKADFEEVTTKIIEYFKNQK